MAATAGVDGSIKIGTNTIGYIDNFSLNINQGVADVSSLGTMWKQSIETVKDWSGSLSGSLDYADAAQKAIVDKFLGSDRTTLELTFVVSSELTLTGAASLSSISVGASVSDKVTISCNFTGNGALSVATGA